MYMSCCSHLLLTLQYLQDEKREEMGTKIHHCCVQKHCQFFFFLFFNLSKETIRKCNSDMELSWSYILPGKNSWGKEALWNLGGQGRHSYKKVLLRSVPVWKQAMRARGRQSLLRSMERKKDELKQNQYLTVASNEEWLLVPHGLLWGQTTLFLLKSSTSLIFFSFCKI